MLVIKNHFWYLVNLGIVSTLVKHDTWTCFAQVHMECCHSRMLDRRAHHDRPPVACDARRRVRAPWRLFLSGLDWGITRMMGIIPRCSGGGSGWFGWQARWFRHGGLAEELRAAWAPGITSAWRCAAVRPGDSPCGRERGTPTDLSWSLRYPSACLIVFEVMVLVMRDTFWAQCF